MESILTLAKTEGMLFGMALALAQTSPFAQLPEPR